MFYIWHKLSYFGMGSNVDEYLISEQDLKYMIIKERERYLSSGECNSDRLLGCWNHEKMCDSSDIEEFIQDVIHKRTTASSTYSDKNDLIEVPDDIRIIEKKESYEDSIFRVFNQFSCKRDIIAGSAEFTNYTLDFRKVGYAKHFDKSFKRYVRFCNFEMKKVLENHYDWKVDELLESLNQKAERLKRRLWGTW